jgi:hypothetical protein
MEDDIWHVSFMDYDLGFFDREVNRVEPIGENTFAPKVLPMCPEWTIVDDFRRKPVTFESRFHPPIVAQFSLT